MKDRLKRIDVLFDKLLERVEHELDTEEHELNTDIAEVVLLLQEYKESKTTMTGNKGADMIIAAINRNMNRPPQREE